MKRDHIAILLALTPIQLAVRERSLLVRRNEVGDRRELAEEFAAAFGNGLGEIGIVIGEIEERRRRGELLSLKHHRRVCAEEEKCSEGANGARGGDAIHAQPMRRVRDLIVIL